MGRNDAFLLLAGGALVLASVYIMRGNTGSGRLLPETLPREGERVSTDPDKRTFVEPILSAPVPLPSRPYDYDPTVDPTLGKCDQCINEGCLSKECQTLKCCNSLLCSYSCPVRGCQAAICKKECSKQCKSAGYFSGASRILSRNYFDYNMRVSA